MRLLTKINQTLGFTKTESRVVLFLVAAFVVGIGIKVYKSTQPPGKTFDYSASDSEFAARSQTIPTVDSSDNNSEATSSETKISKPSSSSQKQININQASKDELMSLPGIGEAMAERIILFRDENGPFTSIDELKNIKGIGEKKLERIAPLCTLGK